jgi:hypothetical protein
MRTAQQCREHGPRPAAPRPPMVRTRLMRSGRAGRAGGALWEDAWDAPGPRFEGFVEDRVRRRLGKYRQPAHPLRLSLEEAAALFKKVRRVILDTERKARRPPAPHSPSPGATPGARPRARRPAELGMRSGAAVQTPG